MVQVRGDASGVALQCRAAVASQSRAKAAAARKKRNMVEGKAAGGGHLPAVAARHGELRWLARTLAGQHAREMGRAGGMRSDRRSGVSCGCGLEVWAGTRSGYGPIGVASWTAKGEAGRTGQCRLLCRTAGVHGLACRVLGLG